MRRYGLSLVSEPPDHTTGVVTYATELARHLAGILAADERLVVLRHAAFPACGDARIEERLVRFPGVRRSGARRLAEQTVLVTSAVRARLTLLHSVQNFGPIAYPGPRVITVHDARLFLDREGAGLGRRIWRDLVYPMSVRRATRLIGDSAWAAARSADAFGIEASRIRVIPLAVDHAAFESVTASDRERVARELRLDRPALVFAGTFGPNKNLLRLLDAFAAVPSAPGAGNRARLVLAGGGGSEEARIRERVKALGLGDAVRFPGHLARRDLLALIALARAFVFPSLEEGFGLPVIEAFAAGTPVLTSDRGALLEVAGDAALLVDPEDTGALARGLARLLDDDALLADLRQRGRARARAYTWDRCARETLEVYRSV